MSLEMLYSESQGWEGCDRLLLHDDRLVIVQGTHVGGRAEYAEIAVPEGETLVAVKPEAILAAARALEGRSAS
jgi:hypothetical protein